MIAQSKDNKLEATTEEIDITVSLEAKTMLDATIAKSTDISQEIVNQVFHL